MRIAKLALCFFLRARRADLFMWLTSLSPIISWGYCDSFFKQFHCCATADRETELPGSGKKKLEYKPAGMSKANTQRCQRTSEGPFGPKPNYRRFLLKQSLGNKTQHAAVSNCRFITSRVKEQCSSQCRDQISLLYNGDTLQQNLPVAKLSWKTVHWASVLQAQAYFGKWQAEKSLTDHFSQTLPVSLVSQKCTILKALASLKPVNNLEEKTMSHISFEIRFLALTQRVSIQFILLYTQKYFV